MADEPLRTTIVRGLTNAEFFERYAAPGRVGLVGGDTLIENAIRRAQRKLRHDRSWSRWAHAFLFQGRRHDGHHWLLESNVEAHRQSVLLGVQEDRVAKYHDDSVYVNAAVLDFGLDDEKVTKVLGTALELLVDRTRYSMREILSVYLRMRESTRRDRKSRLAQDRAMFCSAFVQEAYLAAGIDFALDVDTKLTTPEDIAATAVPHHAYVLERVAVEGAPEIKAPR